MNLFKKLFPAYGSKSVDEKSVDDQLKYATCILMLEVSKSDDDFDTQEQKKIKLLMQDKFNIPEDELEILFELCIEKHNSMTSLYEYTEIINNECSYDQKLKIIGFMWDVAFEDSKIDKYEDFTIRKVSDLIYVKHRDFITLKNDRST